MMNKISPGAIPKFKQSGPAFLLMENVQSFLAAIKKYGVSDEEVFQTPDLFEARNIPQVTLCIYALARTTQKHDDYTGPAMGPKMATQNKRNFTEEEIKRGRDGQIGLQVSNSIIFQYLYIQKVLFSWYSNVFLDLEEKSFPLLLTWTTNSLKFSQ